MNKVISILVVDDHKIVREGLKAFIAPIAEIQIIAEASSGQEAIEKALALKPDVILMDLVMPGMDGIEATQKLIAANPAIRILMVTSFAEDERVMAAIHAGAAGYLLKDSSPEELIDAINAVYHGESYLPPRIATKVIRGLSRTPEKAEEVDPLTHREIDILKLAAGGLTNDEIALNLSISAWTVRSHLGRIMKKIDVDNRTQAALYAIRNGLVTLTD